MNRYPVLFRGAAGTAALLAVGACGGPTINAERNDAVPIPAGATVQFLGQTSSLGTGNHPAAANDTIHRHIQQAIMGQLKAKGYTVVDTSARADFTVRYFLAVQTSPGSHGNPGGGVGGPQITGYGLGYGRTADTKLNLPPTPEPVTNASFEVALVDEHAGRTAWRGTLEAKPKSDAPSQQRINDLVAKVMESLPSVP